IGLIFFQRVLSKGNAKDSWAQGDKFFAAGDYKEAEIAYGRALRIEPSNVEGLVKYGDTLHELVRYDLDKLRKDVTAWEKAVEYNPTYGPGLNRLLDAYQSLSEIDPGTEVFTRMRDKAQAILRINADDTRAKMLEQVGIIGSWVRGARVSDQ